MGSGAAGLTVKANGSEEVVEELYVKLFIGKRRKFSAG